MTVPNRALPPVELAAPVTQGREGLPSREEMANRRTINDLIDLLNGDIPVYADNAAAVTGGLRVGGWYKTSAGAVRIVV